MQIVIVPADDSNVKICNKFWRFLYNVNCSYTQWCTEGDGGLGCSNPPHPEIPKSLQNCAEIKPTVKTVKNC